MKTLKLLTLLLSFSFQLSAQPAGPNDKSLVGTWMETKDSLQEIKIISPSHVFFLVRNIKTDTFAYAGAGTYSTVGNKYTENLQYANFEVSDTGYSFTYKVEGDKLHQNGVFTFKDGTKVPIDHIFTKVKSGKVNNGPHVGTWNQVSSSFTMPDGVKGSHTNATHIRFQVISPTHWMRISLANNKFENAFACSYTLAANKMDGKMELGSMPTAGSTVTLTQRVEGDKLYWAGVGKDGNGKPFVQFEDVFERVKN